MDMIKQEGDASRVSNVLQGAWVHAHGERQAKVSYRVRLRAAKDLRIPCDLLVLIDLMLPNESRDLQLHLNIRLVQKLK